MGGFGGRGLGVSGDLCGLQDCMVAALGCVKDEVSSLTDELVAVMIERFDVL